MRAGKCSSQAPSSWNWNFAPTGTSFQSAAWELSSRQRHRPPSPFRIPPASCRGPLTIWRLCPTGKWTRAVSSTPPSAVRVPSLAPQESILINKPCVEHAVHFDVVDGQFRAHLMSSVDVFGSDSVLSTCRSRSRKLRVAVRKSRPRRLKQPWSRECEY